jgi:hypothetical protein
LRKVLGVVALGLGAFLLVVAGFGQLWAPEHAKRTPLSVDTTTRLAGTAEKLDPATGRVQSLQVRATRVTKSDDRRSDDHVIAFVTTTCLVVDRGDVPDCVDAKDPQRRLITASTDTFAADRRTAEAVNLAKYRAEHSKPHEGLTNKFPFDTQKKTYPFWDDLLAKAVPAKYTGTEKLDGLSTYTFDVDVPPTAAKVVLDVKGEYSTARTIWVEPRTGAIIKQTQHEVRTLANGDPVLDLDIAYTPSTITAAADEARTKARSIWLLTDVAPWGGLVGGLVLLVVGVLLLRPRRRAGSHLDNHHASGRVPTPR